MAHLNLCCMALAIIFVSNCLLQLTNAEYPGVIELVGYSNRRARTYYAPPPQPPTAAPQLLANMETPTLAPPAAKTQADIETVKQNIEKYNKLLTLDTKNLPESQKDMLERIVERVARLKATLEEEQQKQQQQQQQQQQQENGSDLGDSTTLPTLQTETETDPTLLLDETTLLHLQNSMNEQAAMQAAVTAQTTLMQDDATATTINNDDDVAGGASTVNVATEAIPTEQQTDVVDDETLDTTTLINDEAAGATIAAAGAADDEQYGIAPRSNNNNIAAITAADDGSSTTTKTTTTSIAGNQRTLTTSGKLKTRGTKRPIAAKVTAGSSTTSTSTTTNGKRGQRPPQKTSGAATTTTTTTSNNKYKGATNSQQQQQQTTATYYQQQQQQKLQTKPHNKMSQATLAMATNTASTQPTTMAINADQMYQRTPPAAATYNANNNNNDAMVYDAHVNTSAIIDSLNSHAREEYYQQQSSHNNNNNIGNTKQQTVNIKDNKKPSTATAKPTKYHYYPHNQHIYLLPECAIQQVCNAVYVRLNYTQPLCACPSRYRDPCSASLNEDDQHTTKLVGDNKKKAITLAKTCEATTEMRECRSPKDWSLLALQNTRTGKSHYLVICRCPDHFKMEGPMAHDQPTYASVPGIRVFGMMCVKPGYSVRKPSAQPPKRYQLQKPYYRPGSQTGYLGVGGGGGGGSSGSIINNNQYISGTKDNYARPSSFVNGAGSAGSSAISSNYHPQDSFQTGQHSANYPYLHRPESTHNAPNFRPDTFSINNFPGGTYGRNNERRGDAPIEAAAAGEDEKLLSTSTQIYEEARTTLHADMELSENQQNLNENNTASITEANDLTEEQRETRARRSLEPDTPEFPWERVLEFQQTIVWD